MRVLFATAELAPFAKVGGLADVAASLPLALKSRGHDARIVVPAYRMIFESPEIEVRGPILGDPDSWKRVAPWHENLTNHAIDRRPWRVRVGPEWQEEAWLFAASLHGVPVTLIGASRWFNDAVSSETLYQPGSDQYLFFSRAVLEFSSRLGWIPDVIHANDWHTGFIPVLLREQGGPGLHNTASVFTIHNLGYQGEFGIETLDKVGLSRSLFNLHRHEAYGAVNFLKSGAVDADMVNTVSPTYAEEIQTAAYGCRLEGLMRHLAKHGRLRGILNGIDTEHAFNPATDTALPANYSAENLDGKAKCREALLTELGFDPSDSGPVFAAVTRISVQKGLDLVLSGLPEMIEQGGRLAILGLGDPAIADGLRLASEKWPDRVRYIAAFDAPLGQRLYAGADFFLMPSAFEPCGLGQMIAMRYGTPPIVRRTGGLADTVRDGVNGLSFAHSDITAYLHAVERAFRLYQTPKAYRAMQMKALKTDWSWSTRAIEYEQLYDATIRLRLSPAAA